MSEFNIEVEGGSSVRLPTGGKYCPKDIIVTARGGAANNQDKTITKNGVYTADEGYTGLGTVTVSVQSAGGGDIDALIEDSLAEVNSGATKVREYVFNSSSIVSANFPNATSIGNYAFQNCKSLASAYFPNVITIGTNALYGCSVLASANFPNATSIGNYAFYQCLELASANFPNVTRIGTNSFKSCSKLSITDFPNVTSIGNSAFYSCEKLANANFPNATSIGTSVFQNCYVLKSLILRSETVCTLSDTNAFKKCYHINGTVHATYNPNGDKDGFIFVPANLVESYKTATNWSNFASQIRAIEEGGGDAEGNWLFQDMMLDSNGNTSLPAPVVGTSYTLFVDGEEIATSTAESSWDGSTVLHFNTEDYRIYFIYDASTGMGWHFHPIDSQVSNGSVSIRINK